MAVPLQPSPQLFLTGHSLSCGIWKAQPLRKSKTEVPAVEDVYKIQDSLWRDAMNIQHPHSTWAPTISYETPTVTI